MVRVGDVLAHKYRVERVLGIGGMGMVVAATHLELEQQVAVKFMLPEAMRSEQAMERFLREARAAVKLRGEHVCRVLDVGRLEDGAPYIVMELMEGQDFADVLERRGPLSVEDTVDHVLQALEGVAEAHANQIVHRDLKPGNLFVATDSDGSPLVKVLDFGISKSSLAGSATRTGEVMGSPAYMSPEQMASSKYVDARADVWAMGVILYQAVSGALPFDADTLPALCVRVMTGQPVPIATLRTDLPPAFALAIMRCLEKNPDLRFSDVAELAVALAPFGPATAAASAIRIAKVLRRTAAAPVGAAPVLAPRTIPTADSQGAPSPSGTAAAAFSGVRAETSPGRISTLQAGASEVSGASVAPRGRVGLLGGGVAAAVAAGALGLVMMSGRGTHGGGPATHPVPARGAPSEPPAPHPVPVVTPIPVTEAPVAPPVPVTEAPVAPPVPVTEALVAPKPGPALPRTTTRKPPVRPAPAATQVVPVKTKQAEPTPPEPGLVKPPPAASPPAAPTPPNSKWTHMQHDKGT